MISVLLLEKINSLHSLFNSKEVLDLYNTYIILIQHVSVSIYPHKKTPNVQRDSEFSGCAADHIFTSSLHNTIQYKYKYKIFFDSTRMNNV